MSTWWEDLSAAALIGTARRQIPSLPWELGAGRDGASREEVLLDAAALGCALRRAGARAAVAEPIEAAADDVRPPAPPRAVHVLELLLHQSPVGPTLAPQLVGVWLAAADARGFRAPHHLLPDLLDLATRHHSLRPAVLRVGDARAAWLAAANPAWTWRDASGSTATAYGIQDAVTWARQPTDKRAADVAVLRRRDPAAARGLVESTWDTDAAADRATLLGVLRIGLDPSDEPLLERALDDRSAKVREVAIGLLDGLPGSTRAARHAARLRPLIHVKGVLRKALEVDLPPQPDDAGVRDGLSRPKKVGSIRGWWLQRLAAGAPLEVWTEATGADISATWRLVTQQDARVGIVEAVLARGDAAWAAAISADVWHPGLLALLSADQLDATAARALKGATTIDQVVTLVDAVPTPWGPLFTRAVLQRLMAEKDPGALVAQLTPRLAAGLDPSTRPAMEKWRDRLQSTTRDRVTRICQYLALVPEIPEAFT